MDVCENSGTLKSSILIGFSIVNHPSWGTPIFGNTHIYDQTSHQFFPPPAHCAEDQRGTPLNWANGSQAKTGIETRKLHKVYSKWI